MIPYSSSIASAKRPVPDSILIITPSLWHNFAISYNWNHRKNFRKSNSQHTIFSRLNLNWNILRVWVAPHNCSWSLLLLIRSRLRISNFVDQRFQTLWVLTSNWESYYNIFKGEKPCASALLKTVQTPQLQIFSKFMHFEIQMIIVIRTLARNHF